MRGICYAIVSQEKNQTRLFSVILLLFEFSLVFFPFSHKSLVEWNLLSYGMVRLGIKFNPNNTIFIRPWSTTPRSGFFHSTICFVTQRNKSIQLQLLRIHIIYGRNRRKRVCKLDGFSTRNIGLILIQKSE